MRKLFPVVILLIVLAAPTFAVEVTLLYWSDFHARNMPDTIEIDGQRQAVGGAARLGGLVQKLRSASPRTLVLNAGDEFTGSPVSTLTRGGSQFQILSRIGVDAFVPGNHEFDHGWRSLKAVYERFGRPSLTSRVLGFLAGQPQKSVPALLANVTITDTKTSLFQPDTLYDLGGVKVALIGLIYRTFTGSVIRDGVIGIEASDPVVAARLFAEQYRDSADVLIAVTHLGWELDSLLAVSVPNLDVIVGGHSYTPINPPRVVGATVIVQSGPHGRHLGRLVIEVDTAEGGVASHFGELIPVTETAVEPYKPVKLLVDRLERKYTRRLNRTIATLVQPWSRFPAHRSNLAQWAVDALHAVAPQASMAVINNGNLRKDLEAGPVRERDLWEIFPFENSIVIFQLSGSELRRVVDKLIHHPREPMTWSGLTVAAVTGGDGALDVKVRSNPVSPLDEYSVVTTGYVWDNLQCYLGISNRDRPVFFMPGNQREEMVKAAERRQIIDSVADDRWDIK